MYSVGLMDALVVALLVWLGIVSYLFWKEKRFLNKLFPKETEGESQLYLKDRFDELFKAISETKQAEEVLRKNLREVNLSGLGHVQKVELLRYNPYEDVGGNVSFSLVILDGKDSGVLITSLHTRAGTRIYAKRIKEGKSELQLAKEEKEVLEKVINE